VHLLVNIAETEYNVRNGKYKNRLEGIDYNLETAR
jgi:hypothetical protein